MTYTVSGGALNSTQSKTFSLHSPKANKSPLKIMDKTERGRIQGLPKFYAVHPIILSQECWNWKLWTSNLAGTFADSIRAKGHKIWAQGGVGVSRDSPIFWIPPIISGTGKAKNFKFCTHIHRIARNKSPLKISGKVTIGVLRDSRKFPGHAIYRAHRAVIFAIARLSCFVIWKSKISNRSWTRQECCPPENMPWQNRWVHISCQVKQFSVWRVL